MKILSVHSQEGVSKKSGQEGLFKLSDDWLRAITQYTDSNGSCIQKHSQIHPDYLTKDLPVSLVSYHRPISQSIETWQCGKIVTVTAGGRTEEGCYWHLVGRGQVCC